MAAELLSALQVAVVAVGGAVAWRSLDVARRSPSQRLPYLLLALGFGLVTLGAVIEGLLYDFASWTLVSAGTVDAAVIAGGFALILAAILRGYV